MSAEYVSPPQQPPALAAVESGPLNPDQVFIPPPCVVYANRSVFGNTMMFTVLLFLFFLTYLAFFMLAIFLPDFADIVREFRQLRQLICWTAAFLISILAWGIWTWVILRKARRGGYIGDAACLGLPWALAVVVGTAITGLGDFFYEAFIRDLIDENGDGLVDTFE